MQFRYLKYDLYRYFYPTDNCNSRSLISKIKICMTTQGIWAISVYRFRRWLGYENKNKVVKLLLAPIGLALNLAIEIITGIHIEPELDVGPGFYIGHFGSIFIGGKTRYGKFCNISQGCTIGYGGRGEKLGLPELGDFVYIAPGAKIFGKIKIGDHVAIGANAVVTKDLPDNAVAVGIPASVVNYNSSCDFVQYNRNKFTEIL